MTRIFATATLFLLTSLSSAFAHHPLGGDTPTTLMHGLLSGIGHPVIGFDHLAFVIAVGLLAAFQRNRVLMPAGFVIATMIGTMVTLSAATLPMAEIVITLSVLAAGVMVMRGKLADLVPTTVIVAVAGLFHGWAYGAAVIGAETTPIIGYLAGMAMVQMVIALGVGAGARAIWQAAGASAIQARLAGAVVAGVGLTYLVENVEGMLFSGM